MNKINFKNKQNSFCFFLIWKVNNIQEIIQKQQ